MNSPADNPPARWSFSPDRDGRTLVVNSPGVGSITLSTDEVDKLLALLHGIRSSMLPTFEAKWPQGKIDEAVQATLDPAFTVERDLTRGLPLIHLRDPGIGWLHFIFTRERARELIGYLHGVLK